MRLREGTAHRRAVVLRSRLAHVGKQAHCVQLFRYMDDYPEYRVIRVSFLDLWTFLRHSIHRQKTSHLIYQDIYLASELESKLRYC